MMMGAIARMGTVWLATIHGIRLMRSALMCTIAIARAMPRMRPITNPVNVAETVTQAWVSRLRGLRAMPSDVSRNSGVPSVDAKRSLAIWCGAGSSGRSRLHATW